MSTLPKNVKSADPRKGVTRAQIRAAEADLRAFRHDVAVLKRKGLIDKSYDARSVKPGKYILGQIRKFDEVLKGNAATPKVSKSKAAYYKEKGYTVKNNRVIVPTSGNTKVYSTGGDFRVKFIGSTGSITRIDLGLSTKNVNQWSRDLRESKFKFKKNEFLAFQLYGHNSYRRFWGSAIQTPQQQMADYLENYQIFTKAAQSNNPKDVADFIDGIVILKIKRSDEDEWVDIPEDKTMFEDYSELRRARMARRSRQKILREGRMTDEEWERAHNVEAERKRRERARMTPKQKEAYKEAARKRASESYARKKDDKK